MTTETTDVEAIVRQAYHAAEGSVLDVQGFVDLFAEDGVFNNIVGREVYRGELAPDVHRELHRFHVMGDVVAVELSIRGTFAGSFPTPAGVIEPTGAKLDIPTADFWYIKDGKIKEFNCYVGISIMMAQLGVQFDFASAVAASAGAPAAA